MFADVNGSPSDDPDYAPDCEPWNRLPTVEAFIGLVDVEHSDDCPVFPLLENGQRDEFNGSKECDCERMEFSWRSCDACGSTLGGAREAYTVWETAT
jgi:hypothetical protein